MSKERKGKRPGMVLSCLASYNPQTLEVLVMKTNASL